MYTWKQNDRMAGIGMMAAAVNAAMLQMEVVITDTPHFRITLPTWSWIRENVRNFADFRTFDSKILSVVSVAL